MYLFFDTETTGKPKDYKAKMTKLDNWPRVTQLAYVVFDKNQKKIYERATLIYPDEWEIPKEKFFIDNNMSTERCVAEGITMRFALKLMIEQIEKCEFIIAHNLAFDYNVLGAEMIRYGASTSHKTKKLCTMELSTNLLKLLGLYGYKWPKLEELHKYLFPLDPFEGAHDALFDVNATAKCYFEMINKDLL